MSRLLRGLYLLAGGAAEGAQGAAAGIEQVHLSGQGPGLGQPQLVVVGIG